jgi:membrane-associated phospholipid phosphatase
MVVARLPPLRVAATLLAACAVLTLAVVVAGPLPGEQDAVHAMRGDPGAGRDAWQLVSHATDLVPVAVLAVVAAIVLAALGRVRVAVLLLAAPLGAAVVNGLVKRLVRRERPEAMVSDDASAYGFPSGHAAHSTAVALALLLVLLPLFGPRVRLWAVAVAVVAVGLVVVTQLVLARHYPSDLLAGCLLGAAWVALLSATADRESPVRPDPG